MACFTALNASGSLVAFSYSKVFFTDGKNTESYFYSKGNLDSLNFKEVEGLSLFEFQKYLEQHEGSILVPVTETKDNYVYIPGQKDRQGYEIGC